MASPIKESRVIQKLKTCASLALPGVFIRKIHQGMMGGTVGFPDLVFIWEGNTFFMEAKTSVGKLSVNQLANIKLMCAAKACVWVAKHKDKNEFSFRSMVQGGKILELVGDISTPECWFDLIKGPHVNTGYTCPIKWADSLE